MTVGDCAYWACVLEATARKPGNVHCEIDFPGLRYRDFIASAHAIGPVIDRAANQSLGVTILQCLEATRAVVDTNTNLGIVLLIAPLASGDIGDALRQTTVEDATQVYEAIRLARPGGMGHMKEQDVSSLPTVNMREAMALAADRDMIARQYVNAFADVFAGVAYFAGRVEWDRSRVEVESRSLRSLTLPARLERAIIDLYLWFLSRFPDSLVVRKRGMDEALQLQELAKAAIADPTQISVLDAWFAAKFPHRNPGTSADLVCASLFVALRRGIITVPHTLQEPRLDP